MRKDNQIENQYGQNEKKIHMKREKYAEEKR